MIIFPLLNIIALSDKRIISENYEKLYLIIRLPLCFFFFFLRKKIFSILLHHLEVLFSLVYTVNWVCQFCTLMSNKAILHVRTDVKFQRLRERKENEWMTGRKNLKTSTAVWDLYSCYVHLHSWLYLLFPIIVYWQGWANKIIVWWEKCFTICLLWVSSTISLASVCDMPYTRPFSGPLIWADCTELRCFL